ncbi:hypothetical protein ACFQ3R_08450 [Mesonia ostreae]|uniref:Uncharacterized protein n=1 Tax=Mesonia ostreae TaxID=861110 RepID=A0ABU2KF07_9FLAO|nr:hypothetical protein [Mesonia ostreae]MDT0293300.1 hypothetical protein [Mesonia ostreae]
MKNTIATLILIVTFHFTNAQSIERVEVTEGEVEYLEENISQGFSSNHSDEDLTNSVKNNLVTYEYEVVYEDEVLYRGNVSKPSLAGVSRSMNRTKAQFCFEYDLVDAETKLELVEKKKLDLITTKSGDKYFCTDNYDLFIKGKNKTMVVNDQISDKISIKLYKLEYK